MGAGGASRWGRRIWVWVAVLGLTTALWAPSPTGAAPSLTTTLTGQATDLGTLPGTTSSAAVAVDGNVVVGYSESGSETGTRHAFAYDLGATSPKMRDLGTLPGGSYSSAWAVSGNILVGDADSADSANHAFLYDLGATLL